MHAHTPAHRGVTGKCFGGGGGKVTFPDIFSVCSHFYKFFPGVILAFSRWKFPFWSPQLFSVIFYLRFLIFLLPFYFFQIFPNFHPYFFHFSSFSSTFPISSLPHFSRSFAKISRWKVSGGTQHPPPRLLRHCRPNLKYTQPISAHQPTQYASRRYLRWMRYYSIRYIHWCW